MQNWYEFGYNGFPTGERRRRFYRQRDDPCDSQEDLSGGDDEWADTMAARRTGHSSRYQEGSDRPVFYYTLQEGGESDEESTSTGSVNQFEREQWSGREAENEKELASSWGEGGFSTLSLSRKRGRVKEGPCGSAKRLRHLASKTERSRRPTVTSLLIPTFHEDPRLQPRFGATCVSFDISLRDVSSASSSTGKLVLVIYGGSTPYSDCVSSRGSGVKNDFTVLALEATRANGMSRVGAVGSAKALCTPLNFLTLSELPRVANWPRLHPALSRANPSLSAAAAPPRVGHCAVALPLPFEEAATVLGSRDGPLWDASYSERTFFLLSLVYGGSAGLTNERHERVGGATLRNSRLRGQSVCTPGLCVTVVSEKATNAPTPSHYSLYFPLSCSPHIINTLEILSFATMSLWQMEFAPIRRLTYVILGGTADGRSGASFARPRLLHLNVENWDWSAAELATFGDVPSPRFGHSATMIPDGGPCPSYRSGEGGSRAEESALRHSLIVFGGIGRKREYLADIFVLNMRSRCWRTLVCSHSPQSAFLGASWPSPTDEDSRVVHENISAVREGDTAPHHPKGRAFHTTLLLGATSVNTHCFCCPNETEKRERGVVTRRSFDDYVSRLAMRLHPEVDPVVGGALMSSVFAVEDHRACSSIALVVMGGEEEQGVSRTIWSLHSHPNWEWQQWEFPSLSSSSVEMQTIGLTCPDFSSPPHSPNSVGLLLPQVLHPMEQERLAEVWRGENRRESDSSRFLSLVGSLPLAAVLPWVSDDSSAEWKRNRWALETKGSTATTSRSYIPVREIPWQKEAIFLWGGSSSPSSSFLSTTLVPCETSLRAMSRLKLACRQEM